MSQKFCHKVPFVAVVFGRNPVESVVFVLLESYRVPLIFHLNAESPGSCTKFGVRGKLIRRKLIPVHPAPIRGMCPFDNPESAGIFTLRLVLLFSVGFCI